MFLHEFGHLVTAICFGEKPSLVFGQGYFGPALLVYTGIDYGWKYWTVLLNGPLLSSLVLYLLSKQNMLWGFRIAAMIQFLYAPLEVIFILNAMAYLGHAIVVVAFIMHMVTVAFFCVLLISRRLSE